MTADMMRIFFCSFLFIIVLLFYFYIHVYVFCFLLFFVLFVLMFSFVFGLLMKWAYAAHVNFCRQLLLVPL